MEKELILVRHGETCWNKDLKFQGNRDISLNETGFEQANRVSDYLASEDIDSIYSSDLKRALNTAERIADPHDLEVKADRELREMNFGEWEGLTYQEIEKEYPDIIAEWFRDPTAISPPGGEKLPDFQNRVVDAFEEILNGFSGSKILVVSHGGAIRVYLASLLKMPLKLHWRLELNNTGICVVKFYDKKPILSLFNSTFHLEENH